jgi:nucleoside-diphosphate-sugar epimerase
MSKFLVTGGHGFIGHKVMQHLQERGEEVASIDVHNSYYSFSPTEESQHLLDERLKLLKEHVNYEVDIANTERIKIITGKEKPSVIIHCASFPRQKAVNSNPVWAATTMMTGLVSMLEAAKEHGVERFVYISSSMVYGDFEDQIVEDDECNPQGQYGIMKLAGEWLVKDYARRTGMEYAILRPSAVYGPLDISDRVVSKFILAAHQNQILRVHGADEKLDFTFIDDAADGIVAAATRIMAKNNTYNITKSHSVTLLEAAEMIIKIVGKGTVDATDKDADFPSRGALNIDRAKTILGFDPKIDVEEGFRRQCDWIVNSKFYNPDGY